MTHGAATAVEIRAMTPDDVSAVTAIYNEAIGRGESTREFEPQTDEQCRDWILVGDERFSGYVAVHAGEIVGWSALTRLYPRAAYDATAELSIYVAAARRGQGVGRALAADLIARAQRLDYHLLVLFLFPDPAWLVELARRSGFAECGALPEAGYWNGELRDVNVLSLRFEGGAPETAL